MCLRFLLFIVLGLGALGAHAEPPTVGLVLGGGGARGLAHIGVIRYLEERGIRVKAVAGTSIGAVVGGLYASGLNAEELAEVARTLNWRYAFDDRSQRGQLSFRRKQDDYDYLINARIRFNKGQLQLPLGAIQGQHLNFILHDMVAHVRRTSDFDKLPIPYRAVAADIATGEAVVMQSGDLAVAMRASMSIPGVFAPIDLDGRLLIDGGIARNLPVDVVQAMGVDRVIVVDVGTPLTPRDKLDNMLALVDQMTNIMTRTNSQQQLERMHEGDVLIRPELDEAEIGSADFDRTEDAMRLGYEAARALEPQLAALSDPAIAGPVAERPPLLLPRIAEVRVATDAAVSTELLRHMITQPIGEKLDRTRLEHDIGEIYGLDEFVRVDYQVLKESAGYVLAVDATADPAGSSYLKLGMNWEQDSRGTSEFGVRASWRQKAINRLGAEWYTVGQLGGLSLFGTEFHQPLDADRRFFVDTDYQYRQRRLNLAEDGELRARAVIDEHLVSLGGGVNVSNVAALRAGVFAGTSDTDIQIGAPILSSQSVDDGGWYTEFKFDTLDRTIFPGHGARIVSRFARGAHDWGSSIDYDSWNTSALGSVSFGANSFTALARWAQLDIDEAQGGATENLLVPSQAFTLGGFLKLSGYTHDSLAGNYLGFASLVYYRRLTGQSLLPFDFPIYAGASIEAGNVWLRKEEAGFDDMLRAGSVFLGVDSPIGPVYLGVGVGEDRQRALFLQLGQLFD